jgi:hypothetical protein
MYITLFQIKSIPKNTLSNSNVIIYMSTCSHKCLVNVIWPLGICMIGCYYKEPHTIIFLSHLDFKSDLWFYNTMFDSFFYF